MWSKKIQLVVLLSLLSRPAQCFMKLHLHSRACGSYQPLVTRTSSIDPVSETFDFLNNVDSELIDIQILEFERFGHLLTPGIFHPHEIQSLKPSILQAYRNMEIGALKQKVSVLLGEEALLEQPNATAQDLRSMLEELPQEEIPFLQVFNMWRTAGSHMQQIKKLTLSKKLASYAATLLGVDSVRVYQDSLFIKRPGDGPTNWHSDLNMAPFDTNDFITVWIPLSSIPAVEEGGSGLIFASRSHKDFALNYWQDPHQREDLSERYIESPQAAMEPGDLSWHHGWVLHSANGNDLDDTRIAFTISYVADGVRRLGEDSPHAPEEEDTWSYQDWIQETMPGEIVDHPFLPVVWP